MGDNKTNFFRILQLVFTNVVSICEGLLRDLQSKKSSHYFWIVAKINMTNRDVAL